MDVNNMVSALASKTVDAMVNVEAYNALAEDEGMATTIVDGFSSVDDAGVHGGHAGDSRRRAAIPSWPISGLRSISGDAEEGSQGRGRLRLLKEEGYKMSLDTFQKALAKVEVNPGFPPDLKPYMQEQAEVLVRAKTIPSIPDWDKVLRPEFMERARAGA